MKFSKSILITILGIALFVLLAIFHENIARVFGYQKITSNSREIRGFEYGKSYWIKKDISKLSRGDLVVISGEEYQPNGFPNNSFVDVKRVIASEGEKFTINKGQVFVNGHLLEEPYLQEIESTPNGKYTYEDGYVVPEGSVIVLGDYRSRSRDSRMYGPVKIDHIQGVVVQIK